MTDSQAVDLDGSVSVFDSKKEEIETVYYGNLVSKDKAIRHSGDDRVGDTSADDKDNEVISINLEQIDANADTIFFYLNSYKQQDFSTIPYSKIRILEGKQYNPKQVFATFNLSSDSAYKGYVSMLMGKLKRMGNRWEFITIGDAIRAKDITETIEEIQRKYI